MAIVDVAKIPMGDQIKKKLGHPTLYGARKYGKFLYGEYNELYGIYQVRRGAKKQIVVRRRFYTPTNPRTLLQQAHRQLYGQAVGAWKDLTISQKDVYNERAKYKKFSGYNLFIKEYLQSN